MLPTPPSRKGCYGLRDRINRCSSCTFSHKIFREKYFYCGYYNARTMAMTPICLACAIPGRLAAYRPAKKSHSGTTIAWMSLTSTRYQGRTSGSRPCFHHTELY